MSAHSEVVHVSVIEVPPWLAFLVLAVYVAVAVIAGVAIWHATRRKGPPPLPRP